MPLGGQRERFAEPDGLGDHLRDEFIDGFHADHIEHGLQVFFVADADMAFGKLIEH